MVAESQGELDFQHEIIHAYLNVLILLLSRIYNRQFSQAEPFHNRAFYRRFQTCIEENSKQIHQVNAYAQLLNVSASHLNALIKAQSGKTVIGHIHERLLLEAKRILFHTERSVKQVAFELGFRDSSYFNRFFRRMTGQTPLAYRSTIREMYR